MGDALAQLRDAGMSIWLDGLSRALIEDGELAALIHECQVSGARTDPAAMAAAVATGDRYTERLRALAARGVEPDLAAVELLVDDVRAGCDLLLPVFNTTACREGRVSVDLDPRPVTPEAIVAAARELSAAVDRPNLLIKIPATLAGLTAMTAALAEGIGVDATLVVGPERYRQVLDAFMAGLEGAKAAELVVAWLVSTASLPIAPVDREVDRRLEAIGGAALDLRGKAGVANALLLYQTWEQVRAGTRWFLLEAGGALVQRPVWLASPPDGPGQPDTGYVTELVAREAVTAAGAATVRAVADHGRPAGRPIQDRYQEAAAVFAALQEHGIHDAELTAALEADGLARLRDGWTALVEAVAAGLSRA